MHACYIMEWSLCVQEMNLSILGSASAIFPKSLFHPLYSETCWGPSENKAVQCLQVGLKMVQNTFWLCRAPWIMWITKHLRILHSDKLHRKREETTMRSAPQLLAQRSGSLASKPFAKSWLFEVWKAQTIVLHTAHVVKTMHLSECNTKEVGRHTHAHTHTPTQPGTPNK